MSKSRPNKCAVANRRPAGQSASSRKFVSGRCSGSSSPAAEIDASGILGERQRRSVLQPRVAAGYPGFGWSRRDQPQRGCVQSVYPGRNSVGVKSASTDLPRVSAWRQPWALSRNAVGVQRSGGNAVTKLLAQLTQPSRSGRNCALSGLGRYIGR